MKQARKPTSDTIIWRGKAYEVSTFSKKWLKELKGTFKAYQSTRQRDAVYDYLTSVYRFVRGFKNARQCKVVGAHMLALKRLSSRKTDTEISAILRATAAVSEQTRWKWAQCLAYARHNDETDDMREFILGSEPRGINECVDEWARNRP